MDQLLDVKGVASLLKVSPYSIRAWARQGKLNPLRLGRRVLFETTEIERFVSECKSKGKDGRPVLIPAI